MSTVVGVDVSKGSLDVAVLREEGKALAGKFANTPQGWQALRNDLHRHGAKAAHVCLEATGLYGTGVAHFLHQAGYPVSVVNPARIKAYADSKLSRGKTDAGDAALIADFCRTQQPDLWMPPPPEQVALQAMVRHLQDLNDMLQQERNRLQAGVQSDVVVRDLEAHIAFLLQQIDHIQRQIDQHIDQHPPLRQQRELLESIPGIGRLTANRLLAEIRDILAFDSARQLAAFAGLTPRPYQSGTSVHRPAHLSKQGNPHLRACLYLPAVVAMRFNPILADFARHLAAAGKSKMVIIGAVMRKLLHLAYGVLKSGRPFDPNYLSAPA